MGQDAEGYELASFHDTIRTLYRLRAHPSLDRTGSELYASMSLLQTKRCTAYLSAMLKSDQGMMPISVLALQDMRNVPPTRAAVAAFSE